MAAPGSEVEDAKSSDHFKSHTLRKTNAFAVIHQDQIGRNSSGKRNRGPFPIVQRRSIWNWQLSRRLNKQPIQMGPRPVTQTGRCRAMHHLAVDDGWNMNLLKESWKYANLSDQI